MTAVEDLLQLFDSSGGSMYGGEAVTQLEHALQCATLAEKEGASDELVVAALLHDVGHLLHELADDAPDEGIDDCHEASGSRLLAGLFPDAVIEPIRLHVPAKRYLCRVDPDYQKQLSRPSVVSLELQGGPMTQREVDEFDQNPFAQDAIRLRAWDDKAKVPDYPTPRLSHFAATMHKVALGDCGS